MLKIRIADQEHFAVPDKSVLDVLLEAGHEIPNSCRSGTCLTCMMQLKDGTVPDKASTGLKDTLRAQGYFLACQCVPSHHLTVSLPDASETRMTAEVTEKMQLNEHVVQLRIKPESRLEYRPGQYVLVWKSETDGRSYSLASTPMLDGELLEIHVKRMPGGLISNWLHDEISIGDALQLQGANGNCFYMPGETEAPLLMVGTGTGLAPLYGILQDALQQQHQGEIHLVHANRQPSDLYMHASLIELAEQHDNVFYHPVVMHADGRDDLHEAHVDDYLKSICPTLRGWKVYLCGSEGMVRRLQKKCFLAGAAMPNIYADAFVQAPQD